MTDENVMKLAMATVKNLRDKAQDVTDGSNEKDQRLLGELVKQLEELNNRPNETCVALSVDDDHAARRVYLPDDLDRLQFCGKG